MTGQLPLYFEKPAVGTMPYYVIQFLSAPRKKVAANLFHIWHELEKTQGIADLETRRKSLDWWEHEISLAYNGTPTHPLVQQLKQDTTYFNLPRDYFSEMIDGFSMTHDPYLLRSVHERDLFLQRTGGIPALLLSEVAGYRHRSTPKLTQILGSQLRFSYLIRTTPLQRYKGFSFFTQEELSSAGVSENMLSAPTTSPNAATLFKQLLEQTSKDMIATARYIDPQDYFALLPLLSWVKMEQVLLEEIAKDDYKVLDGYTDLTALRKLWTCWKSRGQLKKGKLPF